jgi:hypothetical protein
MTSIDEKPFYRNLLNGIAVLKSLMMKTFNNYEL